MVDKGKEGQRQGVAFRRKSWKQLKKKTGSKKSHSIHTPLFPSYKHKNEDHSFVDNNLDVNYGEGRWQNLPLGFQTTLVIPAGGSFHTRTNEARYTIFQLVFILRVTRAIYLSIRLCI